MNWCLRTSTHSKENGGGQRSLLCLDHRNEICNFCSVNNHPMYWTQSSSPTSMGRSPVWPPELASPSPAPCRAAWGRHTRSLHPQWRSSHSAASCPADTECFGCEWPDAPGWLSTTWWRSETLMRLFPSHCSPAFPWFKKQAAAFPKFIFGCMCLSGRRAVRIQGKPSVQPLKRQMKSPAKPKPWERFPHHTTAHLSLVLEFLYLEQEEHIKKQRPYFVNKGPSSQSSGFSSSHVWMWELDHKEGWALKNWCFWTVVLEKTLKSPVDCKEIKPVNPKGNQPWIFTGKTDAEAPTLWPTWCKEPIHCERP